MPLFPEKTLWNRTNPGDPRRHVQRRRDARGTAKIADGTGDRGRSRANARRQRQPAAATHDFANDDRGSVGI
jgi:hypothetical protein